jgi:hypothetical protein
MIVAGCFEGLPFEEGGTITSDNNIHELIDYFFKLRKNPKDEIPPEYQNLSDRLKKLSLRSVLLSLVSYNYVNEFIDVIQAHFQYNNCGCHMIAGNKIIEDFDNIMYEGVGVVAVGLIVKSDLLYYADKRTQKKKPYLKVTIENNRKLIKTIIWSDKLNDAIKVDLKVGNLVAVHGITKKNHYSGLLDELDYKAHAKLLTGEGEIFAPEK